MARHFIYLTNTRLVSMLARGRRIAARREFAISGAGAEEFNRYLATLRRVPTHILTDLAEEDFRLDTVPHVGAGDREAIFNRRLTQIYRNSPFRFAALFSNGIKLPSSGTIACGLPLDAARKFQPVSVPTRVHPVPLSLSGALSEK